MSFGRFTFEKQIKKVFNDRAMKKEKKFDDEVQKRIQAMKPVESIQPPKLNLPNPNIKVYGMDRMMQPNQKSTIIEAKYLAPSEVKPIPSFPNSGNTAGVAV